LTAHPGGSGIPHAVAAINYSQLKLNLIAVELLTFLFSFRLGVIMDAPIIGSSYHFLRYHRFWFFIILLVYMTVHFAYEKFFPSCFFFFLFSFSSFFLSLIDFGQGNRMKQKQKELGSV